MATSPCFTRVGYRGLLEAALAGGYRFLSFADPATSDAAPRACLLRHDVDVDPWAALELARIEADVAISSTYFVMLRSPFYNLLGRANHEMIEEIIDLGHHVALHYDVAFQPRGGRTHEQEIEVQATAMSSLFGVPVEAVSFHQPSHAPDAKVIRPSGLVCAFDYPGYTYVTDANKADRVREVPEALARGEYDRLQLLIHPVWWATDDPDATTGALFEEALLRNLSRSQDQIVRTERAFGAPRAFRIEAHEP